MFLSAKKVEGCSDRTVAYYKSTMENALREMDFDVCSISTDDIRQYLVNQQQKGKCGKITTDNIRRVLSTFFTWLEDENYILKSPVRRIKKIRIEKKVKETFSDEIIEVMRDSCNVIRDLGMIDLLASTGMRAMTNDQIYNFISDYTEGIITREQFWVMAKFKYPTHQINFCTNGAIKCLEYRDCKEVIG